MTVWFSSDTHYGHKNILVYANRDRYFKNVDEMDEVMIQRWNHVVRPGDRVYHLGDFAFCDARRATNIARRLNGEKYLVFGNHDRSLRKDKDFMSQWAKAADLMEIKVDDPTATDQGGTRKVILCHYAMRVWNKSHFGSFHLFGHSHGTLPDDPNSLSLDVGVDCWDFYPVCFDEVRHRMSRKNFVPVDHHDREKRR